MSLEPEPAPSPRIGDAERDDAVTLLQEHLAAGRLDNAEFNERLDTALGARTMGELVPLFSDLPGRRPGDTAPATDPVPAVAADTSVEASAEVERRKRIGGIVIGSLWPVAIILCFATSWQFWWIILIPVFLSGIIGQAFGVWGDDRGRRRDRQRHHPLYHQRDDDR